MGASSRARRAAVSITKGGFMFETKKKCDACSEPGYARIDIRATETDVFIMCKKHFEALQENFLVEFMNYMRLETRHAISAKIGGMNHGTQSN
jgi:hypothetical protein